MRKRLLSFVFASALAINAMSFSSVKADSMDTEVAPNPMVSNEFDVIYIDETEEQFLFSYAEVPENISSLLPANSEAHNIFLSTVPDAEINLDSEMYSLRSENFATGEGTVTLFSTPIKYLDENGDLQFIDTSMTVLDPSVEDGYAYRNTANSVIIEFGSTADKGIRVNKEFTMTPMSSGENDASETSGYTEEADNGAGKMVYPNAFGEKTTLEYINTETGVKENIILKEYTGKNKFDFLFRSDTYKPVLIENGKMISIVPLDNPDTEVFKLASIYAYDSWTPDNSHEEQADNAFRHLNEDGYYTISETDDGYIITAVVPEEYLTHPDIVYPVTIDPPISNGSEDVEDLHFKSDGTKENLDYLQFGNTPGKGTDAYIRFSRFNSTIPLYATITDARLEFTFRTGQNTGDTGAVTRVTTSWSEISSSRPSYSTDFKATCAPIYNGNYIDKYSFNITSLAQRWCSGSTSNYGVRLAYNTSKNDYNSVVSSDGEAWRAPTLTVSYTTTTETPGIMSGAVYYLRNQNSDRYLDADKNTGNLIQYSYHGELNQQWKVTYIGTGLYTIKCLYYPHNGKVLSVENSSNTNGANISLSTYTGASSQRWRILRNYTGGYSLMPAISSSKVMDVNGQYTTDYANIHLWDYHREDSQRWAFERAYNYGYKGYAIYCTLPVASFDWHAALMDKPYITDSSPTIHMGSSAAHGISIQWCTFDKFLSGQTYTGIYRPQKPLTDADKGRVISLARQLLEQGDISYTVTKQLDATLQPGATKIQPTDVTSVRCDGFVEYCYEYYGYRIYGDDDHWDITKSDAANVEEHAGNPLLAQNVSPKKQAQNYMIKIGDNVPNPVA